MATFDYWSEFDSRIDHDRLQSDSEYFNRTIAERNAFLDYRFNDAVRNAGWILLAPSDTVANWQYDRFLVVGAAPWSKKDLELLDRLEERSRESRLPIFVFNMDLLDDQTTRTRFLPSINRLPTQTPVVVRYDNKVPIIVIEGDDAVHVDIETILPT